MRAISCATLVTVAVLLIPSRAAAFPLGNMDIVVSGIADVRYDDNLTLVKDNKKDDMVTSLGIGVNAAHQAKLSSFLLGAAVRRNLYADNSQFDNWATDITADYTHEFSPYDRLRLYNTFTRSEEPTSFEDAFGVTSGRYTTRRNRFGAQLTRDISPQTGITGRYNNEYTSYSRADLASSDYNSVGLELDHILSAMISLSGSYDFSHRTFRPGRQASGHSFVAGVRNYFTSRLFLDGTCGVDFINTYTGRDITRPAYSLSLVNDIDERSRLSLVYTNRYETNSSTEDIFGYWQTTAAASTRLQERLAASASLFYGKGSYERFNIEDSFRGASLGLTYDLTRIAQATLGYRYSQTHSNFEFREYRRNHYSAGIRVQF